MLDLLPKKKPPAPAPKVKPVADLLPDKLQPKAPKPEFGAGAVNPKPRTPKADLRPGGRTPEPQFRVTQPTNNVTPRRNNLSLQRTNLRAPSIPKPPAAVPGLFGRLKGIRGGPLTTAVNLATGAALDKYVVQPVAKAGGDALARGLLDITGKGDRARQIQPSLYGKVGPDLTPDIVQGIKSREPRGRSNTPPAEGPVNNPDFGKPGTVQPKASPKPLSAAAKDFDRTFAARRAELKRQGKDPNSGTFTWRGKSYNTKLKEEQVPIHPAEDAFNKSTPEARAANMKKYGTPYPPIDTSRRSGDRTAPAWMRGGFKSRDEYNKLDQATKDLLN